MAGVFTISLDLELYWGVRDKRTLDQYRANLAGVREAATRMLESFVRHEVHATWAAVGFLYFADRDALTRALPAERPRYADRALSPYDYIERERDLDPALHFAPDLIELIRRHPGQEIGTHTFSHYYCLEPGEGEAAFRSDLERAIAVARARGIETESLVFPRNQLREEYLPILAEYGIRCYRGNEDGPLYAAAPGRGQTIARRAVRVLDAYVNLTGHHTYPLGEETRAQRPYSLAASRFLRPYSRRAAPLEGLRLRRITRALSDAAAGDRVFHLWWHPHNFGRDIAPNIAFLERILEHFVRLRESHGMRSLNMRELAESLESGVTVVKETLQNRGQRGLVDQSQAALR